MLDFKSRLGFKLVLISMLCILPAIIIAGVVLHGNLRSVLLEQIEASLKNSLEYIADQIHRELFHINNTSAVIATDANIRKLLDKDVSIGINGRLNRIAAVYPELNYILVLDRDSRVFGVTTINGKKIKIHTENLLGEAVDQHPLLPVRYDVETSYSSPSEDPYFKVVGLQQQYSQWFVSPVMIRGKPKGWVVLSYQFEVIMTRLQKELIERLNRQGYPALASYIVDDKGNLVAGVKAAVENTLSQQVSIEIADKVFYLNVHLDKEKAMKPIQVATMVLVSVFVPMVMVLVAALYFSIRKILLVRVKQLELGAQRFADGNYQHRVNVSGRDELSLLAEAFNTMGARVLNARSNLEEQVDIRTREARQALSRLQAVLSSAADGIITFDREGAVLSLNSAAEKLFGYTENTHDLNIQKLIYSSGENHIALKLSNFFAEDFGFDLAIDLEGETKTGDRFPVHVSIAEVESSNGNIYSAIIRDITLIKATETELIRAKDNAEDAARSKSEFLASMSHEIRTPMNGVIGMLGLLMRGELTTDQEHYAQLASSSAESLLVIINDILDFSKVESGKLELDEIDFNLQTLLGDVVESVALKFEEKGVELVLDTTAIEQDMVRGDPGRIRQVMINLLGNAIEFTQEGEVVVCVGSRKTEHHKWLVQCSVIDTGVGIEERKLESIFDSFTQVDASTTRKYGGTGLGLSIAKRLCELMDGEIRASSVVGQGSEFTFSIELQSSAESSAVIREIDLAGTRILVVDDNATSREVLRRWLQGWGGEVFEADGAGTALDILRQSIAEPSMKIFDVVFLDMQMPEMDGAEVGRIIRSESGFNDTRLVMMTSMSARGDASFFASLGFDAYFPKPMTSDDLYSALAVVVQGGDLLADAQPLVTRHYLKELAAEKGVNTSSDLSRIIEEKEKSILLVEDNRINQELALGLLQEFGLQCDIANNGLEAIETLLSSVQEKTYSLLLMDCQMPKMDGYEATQKIRQGMAGELYSAVPIIAMTANAMVEDRQRCLNAGMDDYVSKPIDVDVLEKKLKQWLSSAQDRGRSVKDLDPTSEIDRPQLTVWEKASALKRVGGKEERLIFLVKSFLSRFLDEMKALKALIANNDMAGLKMSIHTLKGVAGNLSALQLSHSLTHLEYLLYERNGEGISSYMHIVNTDSLAIEERLTRYIDNQT